jgi:hypothetical protein
VALGLTSDHLRVLGKGLGTKLYYYLIIDTRFPSRATGQDSIRYSRDGTMERGRAPWGRVDKDGASHG